MFVSLIAAAATAGLPFPVLTDAYLDQVRGAMEAHLPDYGSTKVKTAYDMFMKYPNGSTSLDLCIMANTKNRFGGYDGFRWYRFVKFTSSGNYVLASDENDQLVCNDHLSLPVDQHDYGPDVAP